MNGGGVHAWMAQCHIRLVCVYRSGFCLSLRGWGGGGGGTCILVRYMGGGADSAMISVMSSVCQSKLDPQKTLKHMDTFSVIIVSCRVVSATHSHCFSTLTLF